MNVFNHDGTTRPSSPRSDYSKKGNRQEYSIFGWADEPASLRDAKSETQRMLNAAQERTQASTPSKVAGVRTNGADWKIPHRPCVPPLLRLRGVVCSWFQVPRGHWRANPASSTH